MTYQTDEGQTPDEVLAAARDIVREWDEASARLHEAELNRYANAGGLARLDAVREDVENERVNLAELLVSYFEDLDKAVTAGHLPKAWGVTS